MEKQIEMAKILMRGDWFSETSFNGVMNSVHRWDMPDFKDVANLLESKKVLNDDCTCPDVECPRGFLCEGCIYHVERYDLEYHFKDSPSREECEEQIQILKYFNVI